MTRISYLVPITEAAHEYFEMLRHIPIELKGGTTLTMWDLCNKLLEHQQNRLRGRKDYNDRPLPAPTQNPIQVYSDRIRKVFRRRDRIVWAMRYVKYWTAVELKAMVESSRRAAPADFFTLNFGQAPKIKQPSIDEVIKALSWLPIDREWWGFPNDRVSGFYAAKKLADDFSHIMDFAESQYEGNPLQRYDFARKSPQEVKADLDDLERKMREVRKQHSNAIAEKGTLIVKFADRSGWWDLGAPYCSDEARAMGHCGNAGAQGRSDQTVLSYRTRAPKGAAGTMIPHLTFILHQGSILGEMKGRFNNKPEPRYHPQIVELLKQPFIKMVLGGGYKPEANFCLFASEGMPSALRGWTDLSPELAKALHDVRPELYYQGSACNYCNNETPEGMELDRSDARSVPWCSKYRALKRKTATATIGQKLSSLDGGATGAAPP